MLSFGPRLHGAPGAELSATFSARESEPLLLPDPMNPLEIDLLASALEKTPGEPVSPLRIALAHTPKRLGQPSITLDDP